MPQKVTFKRSNSLSKKSKVSFIIFKIKVMQAVIVLNIYTFLDYAEGGGYEDDETLTEQVIKELRGLITFELA